MFLICVSSSCFILFVLRASGTVNMLWSVHIWHKCILKISKSICNHLEMYLKDVLESLDKGETLKLLLHNYSLLF